LRITIGRRLRRDKRGVSNILVVVLSLVIIVTIVANVILWSYQMNQMDWERIKEDFKITDVARVTHSPWSVAQSEYTMNRGSLVSGSYTDTQAVDGQYERFAEALASPTYYPSGYSVSYGTYVSGAVPSSVQTVDTDYFVVRSTGTATSTTPHSPSGYSLLGGTTLVSGTTDDLASNNGVYMTFRSYDSATSAQTLTAHQETTTIGGTTYYLQKLASADAAGTSLAVSAGTVGRQLAGKFVYPLTGVSFIPASPWTIYYRAWKDTALDIAFDAQSSTVTQTSQVTSLSWSHTTGAGNNRLLLVAVGVHANTGTPTTVSNVTYDGVLLTQVTTALYSATDPQVRTYVFQLVNPASGTKTITVNFAAATYSVAGATTYANVDQTTPIQTSNTATGSGTAPSVSVTVTGSGRWLFGHLGGHRTAGGDWTITEGTGQTNRWAEETKAFKGRGSDKSVSAGSQSMSWTLSRAASYVVSALVINPAVAVAHADVDVVIRQSNGTIRTTRATNVANSGDLTSTATTLSGTHSWTAYTVVDQTDYVEIDYYIEVTTAVNGLQAYLRIDDNTLAISDQTRATNVSLPSEYTSEVEFTGSSNTASVWTQLVWTVDSAWTTGTVTVTLQLYNYTLGNYPTSGNGFISYTSSATPNTDETKTQTLTTNPTNFRDGSGNWKIKVKGVKTTTAQFDFKADWIEFKPTHYSEYTVSTEFTFSGMTTYTPTQLNFTVVSEYDIVGVSVTVQVWNYSSSAYVTSGEGYLTYTASGSNETKLLSINTNPHFYTSNGNAKIKVSGVLTTIMQYQQRVNQVKLDYKVENRLDIDGVFVIGLSAYPLAYIQTVEVQLRCRANDTGEKWYLKAYNWTALTYSDVGFNDTDGHTPTTGWDYYTLNLTDKWSSYVSDTGTVYVKFQDNQADSDQTTVDIDFLGVRAKVDGARFTFENECSLTLHLVSLWVINSTLHQHYNADVVLNSAETYSYIRADIRLPSGIFTVKVVSERGNVAVYSSVD